MKDPLSYFLQEGFGNIYAFPAANGIMQAHFRWATHYKDFVPTLTSRNGNYYFTIKGVTYKIDDAFFLKYTVFVDSEEEAIKLIAEKNAEWEMTLAEITNI
jgi:hypothetical protein